MKTDKAQIYVTFLTLQKWTKLKKKFHISTNLKNLIFQFVSSIFFSPTFVLWSMAKVLFFDKIKKFPRYSKFEDDYDGYVFVFFPRFFHFFWEFYSRLSEHWQKMRLVICFFDSRKYKNIESRPDKFHLRNKTKNDSTSAGEKGDLNILSNMRDISRLLEFFSQYFSLTTSRRGLQVIREQN